MRSGDHRARSLGAGGAARKRQQRDIAGALDGHAQPSLVPRADAGHAAWQNLAALLHELRQNIRALVIDKIHLFDTKLADFLFAEILALAAGTPPGTARSTGTTAARAAFTPPTARAAFAPRRSTTSTWRWCLFLFLWHAYHPSEFFVVSFEL